MMPLVVRQSVILKCRMQASILLGNYEFYYGAGLFCKIRGISVEEDILPKPLKEKLLPELNRFLGEEEKEKKEKYLAEMLFAYEAQEEYDGQMKELLLWGLFEKNIWNVN